jgi:hypothetical protein
MSVTSEASATLANQRNPVEAAGSQAGHGDPRTELRKQVKISLFAAAAGAVIAVCGVIAFLARIQLAAIFLGAHILFGLPVAEADATKILIVTVGSLGVIGYGGFTFVGGALIALIVQSRGRAL